MRAAKRITVVGAGAIGGYLAVRLANAGHCVSVVQRGPALQAIRDRGLVLHEGGTTLVAHVPAAARCADLERQDIVFLTVKATGLRAVAPDLASLLALAAQQRIATPALRTVHALIKERARHPLY